MDLKPTLKALGITQDRFGRLLLVDKGTTSRWALGRSPMPRAAQLVLGALSAGLTTIDRLEAMGAGLDDVEG